MGRGGKTEERRKNVQIQDNIIHFRRGESTGHSEGKKGAQSALKAGCGFLGFQNPLGKR